MLSEATDSSFQLIGQEMVRKGLLTAEQLDTLIRDENRSKKRLGEAAVEKGFLSERQLAEFLAEYLEFPFVDLDALPVTETAATDKVSETVARRHTVIAIYKENGKKKDLMLVMHDPLDVRASDSVNLHTGMRLRKCVGTRTAIMRAIERCYNDASQLARSMDSLLEDTPAELKPLDLAAEDLSDLDELRHQASDAPVVQFVNLLLMRAVQERASDIHVEPEEHGINVRLRVDGKLQSVAAPKRSMLQAVTTRIKLLGNLDIAERRLPQDGRFKFKAFDKTIDVRLNSLPTVHGEKLVMRILDRSSLILDMKGLGFEPEMQKVFMRALKLPYGLIVITGPTGSGKTTTLYTALNAVKDPTKNVVTVEDPVEYQLAHVNQVQARSSIGLTFAAGLRAILRQDPDIVMVGEIRDQETAEICIRAALTGHLVLSTLHTNDAVSAINRLVDMGIEPYLLTASLNLLMAQRLVRRLCVDCAEPDPDAARWDAYLKTLPKEKRAKMKLMKPKGCPRCSGTGYRGRVAIYEQFVINDAVRDAISRQRGLQELRDLARANGLQSLWESAMNKALEGVTTIEEAISVCATQAELIAGDEPAPGDAS